MRRLKSIRPQQLNEDYAVMGATSARGCLAGIWKYLKATERPRPHSASIHVLRHVPVACPVPP